jgi:alpha-L-fucosidase 2
MLLQSHAGELELLPALPSAWPTGQIKGLRARRGFTVDIAWRESRLAWAGIHSHRGGPCRLRAGRLVQVLCDGQPVTLGNVADDVVEFETTAGKIYRVQ